MRNMLNSNQSVTGLVEKYIGSAYDNVKLVADNIHTLDHVLDLFKNHADVFVSVERIAAHIPAIEAIYENIDAILALKGVSSSYNFTYGELKQFNSATNLPDGCLIELDLPPFELQSYYGIALFVNGVYQALGRSYTLNGLKVHLSERLHVDDVVSVVVTDKLTNTHSNGVGPSVNRQELRLVAPQHMTVVQNITTLNLTPANFFYGPGKNELMIYRDGRYLKQGFEYLEVNPTTISILAPLPDGTTIDIIRFY